MFLNILTIKASNVCKTFLLSMIVCIGRRGLSHTEPKLVKTRRQVSKGTKKKEQRKEERCCAKAIK